MSLKAGGVGLNLTAASNVFLMVIIHEKTRMNQSSQRVLKIYSLILLWN